MLSKAKAWNELLKLGKNSRKHQAQIAAFFRGNVIHVLREEGWFEFLSKPRTADEILSHFGYTDPDFLAYVLQVLVDDGVLVRENATRYSVNGPIEDGWVQPDSFDKTMTELWEDHGRAIPARLRGEFLDFNSGLNLFNWDDALANQIYEQIRRSAFTFTNAWNRPGHFLDIGSGTGYGTAAIWSYYYKRGHMKPGSNMRIVGIEPNEKFLVIAREEFPRMLRQHLGDDDFSRALEEFPAEFKAGYAESIPFDDETFDYVYASQILHWTKPKEALREMLRVTKPGGFVFGTENFYSEQSRYWDIHCKVVRGSYGFFPQEDFVQWAKDLGAKKVRTATPVTVFQILK